jgi:hypothetical protein
MSAARRERSKLQKQQDHLAQKAYNSDRLWQINVLLVALPILLDQSFEA